MLFVLFVIRSRRFFENFRIDFAVLEVVFAVMVVDLTQNAAGIAHRHHVIGQIFGYHTARAHHYVVSDGDAGQDDGARADPAVSADVYGSIVLVCLLTQFEQNGVSRRGDDDAGAEHGIVAHVNVGVVHAGQVVVCVCVVAEVYVIFVEVCVKRRLDAASLADLGKHFAQHPLPPLSLGGAGHIEIVQAVETA